MSSVLRATLLAATFATSVCGATAQEVTFAGGGGTIQDAMREAWLKPAAAIGITFKEDTQTGLPDLRAKVAAGATSWDIVNLGAHDCVQGSVEGLFEPLDFAVVKPERLPKKLSGADWVGAYLYSNVIGWNTRAFGANGPQTWADVWDTKKFPGPRAFRARPIGTLEAALLADGQSPENLYPIDVDRAFRSMAKIKPSVSVWWTTGAQQIQLLRDGEVDISLMWTTRIVPAVQDGAPVKFTWNQGLLVADCFAVPKGSRKKEAAMRAIGFMLDAKQQANFAKLTRMGPINPEAYQAGILSEKEIDGLPSAPQQLKVQTVIDYDWWQKNGAKMQERYDSFLAR